MAAIRIVIIPQSCVTRAFGGRGCHASEHKALDMVVPPGAH